MQSQWVKAAWGSPLLTNQSVTTLFSEGLSEVGSGTQISLQTSSR